ncbi:MAG: rRNA maturation RNase YbeY [Candidatus Eremiobacteraeota bacterium]|nr:rRNA maturation RNase YbeY [Candidatus Eremiobacteraeota bacterium]
MIYFRNSTKKSGVDANTLKRTAHTLLEKLNEPRATLSVSLVSDAKIRRLNRLYRAKDSSTDVLSFPLMEQNQHPERERLLGDIIISVDTARRQANAYSATLQNEVHRLLIHGILHVLGHDHQRKGDRARMEAEERRLAEAIAMPWPYGES